MGWRRDEPQFYNAYALEWTRSAAGEALGAVDARVLSKDAGTGSTTLLARLEPGWTATLDGSATLELFVLEGALALEGEELGSGAYCSLPRRASAGATLHCLRPAQVFAVWNPQFPAVAGDEVRAVPSRTQPWYSMDMPGSMHGAMHKSFRLPDLWDGPIHGTQRGMFRLCQMTPGYADPRPHVHSVWEEMLFVSGDMLLWERGRIAPGTYLGNPAEFWHAPMISQRGALMLLHTVEAIDQVATAIPGGQEVADGYRDTESWLAAPVHECWDSLPDYGGCRKSALPASVGAPPGGVAAGAAGAAAGKAQ